MICFIEYLGLSYQTKLCGAMGAIELAYQRNWHNLWLETYSSLVVLAFKNSNQNPRPLRNRWNNVKILLRHMNFIISHIYREGNQVEDTLANKDLTLNTLHVWNETPRFIIENYVKDRLSLPKFRFVSF